MINSLDSFLHSGASLFSSQPSHSYPTSSSPALQQLDLAAPDSPLGPQGHHSRSSPFNIMTGGPSDEGMRRSHSHPGLLDLGSFVGADQPPDQQPPGEGGLAAG